MRAIGTLFFHFFLILPFSREKYLRLPVIPAVNFEFRPINKEVVTKKWLQQLHYDYMKLSIIFFCQKMMSLRHIKILLSVYEIILTILWEMAIISPIFTLTKKLVCRLSQVCRCFQFSLIQGIWKRKGLFSYYTRIATIKTFIQSASRGIL